jgi:hypothetical protein
MANTAITDEKASAILDELEEAEASDPVEPSEHTKQVEKTAAVVPIQTAPKRRRMAPLKVDRRPDWDAVEYHREMLKCQAELSDNSEVVKAIRADASSLTKLRALQEQIAMAASSLEFQQWELQKRRSSAKDTAQIISRRISALKEVANIEREISQFSASTLNLRDERLQRIFAMFLEVFRDILNETLPDEQFDLIWNKLETALEGWENKADEILR